MSLTDLPNIGKELAIKLETAGIHSLEDTKGQGSLDAVSKIHCTSGGGCLNMLFALEGAIQGMRWHSFPREERNKLKERFREAFGNL